MKTDKLHYRLKEFYLLEKLQLSYYQTQQSSSQDERYRKAFERMAVVETGHVDYFKQALDKANITVPLGTPSLASLGGMVTGNVVELTGPANIYRLGMTFESKAVQMYQAFILEGWGDSDLQNALWHFMIDEEMHLLWMKDYVERTKDK